MLPKSSRISGCTALIWQLNAKHFHTKKVPHFIDRMLLQVIKKITEIFKLNSINIWKFIFFLCTYLYPIYKFKNFPFREKVYCMIYNFFHFHMREAQKMLIIFLQNDFFRVVVVLIFSDVRFCRRKNWISLRAINTWILWEPKHIEPLPVIVLLNYCLLRSSIRANKKNRFSRWKTLFFSSKWFSLFGTETVAFKQYIDRRNKRHLNKNPDISSMTQKTP